MAFHKPWTETEGKKYHSSPLKQLKAVLFVYLGTDTLRWTVADPKLDFGSQQGVLKVRQTVMRKAPLAKWGCKTTMAVIVCEMGYKYCSNKRCNSKEAGWRGQKGQYIITACNQVFHVCLVAKATRTSPTLHWHKQLWHNHEYPKGAEVTKRNHHPVCFVY